MLQIVSIQAHEVDTEFEAVLGVSVYYKALVYGVKICEAWTIHSVF